MSAKSLAFVKRTAILVVALIAASGGLAVASLPPGTETTKVVVQNAGESAANASVQFFGADGTLIPGATQNLAGIAPGGSRIVPGMGSPSLPSTFAGHPSPSSSEPLASLLVREVTTNSASDNHSYSIATVRDQGAPTVALPILLSDFSSERWTSRFTVLNVGSELACVRIGYFISASLSNIPVGTRVVDSPTGQSGCATGYRLPPQAQLTFGDAPTASYPYPAGALSTQSAGLIEVVNANGRNDVVATADIYRSDGNRLLGSYDGFAVRPPSPATDDVGTSVIMPLAIKHISGYYSVIGVQNLGSVAADVNIRYLGSTESGTPVDTTVTLTSVANVGFHSTYDESTPIPIDFVGYAVVTSSQPVAAVIVRGKQTWYLSGINEPTYTAVNGVPRDRGETEWSLPLIYRRVQRLSPNHIGWNSWIQVQVADGSSANVTIRFVGTPASNCPEGPFQSSTTVNGSKVFYMNADSDNGFPAGQSPACFLGAAQVSSSKPLIVIANVSSDNYPGGDNEALYNGVPASGYLLPVSETKFKSISTGETHVCGVKTNDTVACWGANDQGQATPPAGTFLKVSTGFEYTCGVKTDGKVACWGDNWNGLATPPVGTFSDVSAGADHVCGVKTDGRVACWGDKSFGGAIPPSGTFTRVTSGGYFSCGLRSNGTVVCWGVNIFAGGVELMDPPGVYISIDMALWHACGVQSNGIPVCWGWVFAGNTGAMAPPPGTFTSVSTAGDHSCGLKEDRTVACWGDNDRGQSSPPPGVFASIDVANHYSCGLRPEGTLVCWGADDLEQATQSYADIWATPVGSLSPMLTPIELLQEFNGTVQGAVAEPD